MRSAFDLPGQQPGAFEHAKMFGRCGLGNVEWLPQLARRAGASPGEHSQHGPPGSVPQGVEGSVERMIIMYSHMAML